MPTSAKAAQVMEAKVQVPAGMAAMEAVGKTIFLQVLEEVYLERLAQ